MHNAAEPARAANESVKSTHTLRRGKACTPNGSQSEAATLVCAIAVAVFMGIACGAWINARLASAASPASTDSIVPPAPAHLLPAAPSVETPTTSTNEAETGSANASVEASETLDTRPRVPAEKELERSAAGAVKPSAGEVHRSTKSRERIPAAEGAGAKSKAMRGQGSASPCALYASADSLHVRGGGAATLFVGGPGEAGRVSVTTPDWSNIAVLSEGRAGVNGWFKYSVRSVSKKSGVYTVRFTTPCGSRNIRVTVVQP
jgi:hypothetical protein